MKTYFTLVALCLLAFSCKKNNNDDTVTPKFTYIINGITDLKVPLDSVGYMGLEIKQKAGTQEKVTLFISGLPEKVTASFSTQSGIPDFTSILTINAPKDAVTGKYPVKLKGVSQSGDTLSYDINLDITPKYNCINGIVGSYEHAQNCGSWGSGTNTSVIAVDPSNPSGITISEMYAGKTVTATVNCDTKKITIPYQEHGPISISGSGLIIGNTITFDVKMHMAGFNCTSTFTKK